MRTCCVCDLFVQRCKLEHLRMTHKQLANNRLTGKGRESTQYMSSIHSNVVLLVKLLRHRHNDLVSIKTPVFVSLFSNVHINGFVVHAYSDPRFPAVVRMYMKYTMEGFFSLFRITEHTHTHTHTHTIHDTRTPPSTQNNSSNNNVITLLLTHL